MKKILFVLPSLGMGGLERLQVTIANALAEKGYDITIMSFDDGKVLVNELHPNVRFIHKRPKYEVLKRVPKIKYLFDDGLWETRASAKALYKYYVGKEKYDVEVAFFRGRAVKIISGSTNPKAKKLVWVHSDFKYCSGYQSNFVSMDEVRNAYLSFDNIICVSQQAKDSFQQVMDIFDNVAVIYNMLPIKQIYRLANMGHVVVSKRHKFNVVLVGRLLDSVKGQTRMINAVAKLQKENIDVGLILVGDGPDKEHLMSYIKKCDLEQCVYMVGIQQNPYLYIKQADLLVCASYFEGYNLTVAEALVCGTPVLSTKCTGPCEILDGGKYGMLVENSEEGLYSGLKELIKNPTLLKEYRRRAIRRQEFFETEKNLEKITKLFETNVY